MAPSNLIIYSLLCIVTSARVVKYPQNAYASHPSNSYYGDNLKHPEKRQSQLIPQNSESFVNLNEDTAVKFISYNERDNNMKATSKSNNNDLNDQY